MMHSFIYGLFDSATPEAIRYVGKAHVQRINERMREHMRDAAGIGKGNRESHKARWIRAVLAAGGAVRHRILAAADSNEAANVLERSFIASFRLSGIDLTNTTEGGDGQSVGYRWSAEARAKASIARRGRKRSREAVEKTAAFHRGKVLSAETRARISAAKIGRPASAPKSIETRAKLSAAQAGKPKPYMAAINAARVYTPELRARISAAQRLRYARAADVVALG